MWIVNLAIIALVIVLAGFVIYHDTHNFKVREYEVSSDKLDRDFVYVFLTDLHGYFYGRNNERLIEAVDRISPDAVFCAGDMITATKNHRNVEVDSGLRLLEDLSSRYPVYISNGNHEEKIKVFRAAFGNLYDRYKSRLKRAGAIYLENESAMIEGTNIRVTGLCLDMDYFPKVVKMKMPQGHIESLVGKVNGDEKDNFQILIAHNPIYFKDYAKWGADLALSGHVHGGIIRLPFLGGVISPAISLFPKYDAGMFKEGNSTMILSRGLGTHTIHVRMFNPGEVSVIKLRGKKNVT